MKNVIGRAQDFSFWAKAMVSLAAALLLIIGSGNPSPAEASTWVVGDVFAGIGNGQYQVYDNLGNFKETITQSDPSTGGVLFSPSQPNSSPGPRSWIKGD